MGWFYRALFAWLARREHQTLIAMGRAAGGLMYSVLRIRRSVTETQLRQCFPDWDDARVHAVAAESYKQLATTFAEGGLMGQLAKQPPPHQAPPWLSSTGFEHLEQALAQGKGVIAVSGHLGNWDLFAFTWAWLGVKLSIVARDIEDKALNQLWVGVRESSGLKQISAHRRQGSMKEMLLALRRNEVVALVLDQNMSRDKGVFVDFFGRPACTLALAAILAKRTGAPVVPAFMLRQPDGTHRTTVLPALAWEDAPDDITHNTQRYTRVIEDLVRAHPEQWLWAHRRWKTQP